MEHRHFCIGMSTINCMSNRFLDTGSLDHCPNTVDLPQVSKATTLVIRGKRQISWDQDGQGGGLLHDSTW